MRYTNHGDMVANILDNYDSATPDQVAAGARWYEVARNIVRLIAEDTGVEEARVAMALSALSPRNPWRWNVADAYAFTVARATERTIPTATTYTRNRLSAWRALNAESPWSTAALKVRSFAACILGDHDSVVVDTWAARVATAGGLSYGRGHSITPKQYRAIAAAYVDAAEQRGVLPATMQAVTWLVSQTEGLASSRRGRHDLSYKAGTPEWLRAALAEGSIE